MFVTVNVILVVLTYALLELTFEMSKSKKFPWPEAVGIVLIVILFSFNLLDTWAVTGLLLFLLSAEFFLWLSKRAMQSSTHFF